MDARLKIGIELLGGTGGVAAFMREAWHGCTPGD